MFKYYGNKGRFRAEIRAVMPLRFDSYLELCGGLASVARTIIPSGINRTVVEKDPGMVALLTVTRDKPEEFANAMSKIPYSRESFEIAEDIKNSGYVECSPIVAAVAKKILTEMSYNAACNSYRDIDKHEEDENERDRLHQYMKAKKYRERYYRQIVPDIFKMSAELQDIDIVHDDFMNYLVKLDDEARFVLIDPPYRPAVRQAKHGYDVDMTDTDHIRFMQELLRIHSDGKLRAKVMIFGYVEENLTEDLYCRCLLPLGFRLIFLKDIYLPKIFRDGMGMGKKKTKKYECIFINYDDCVEQDYITEEDRVFTYDRVFGNGGK